jgi:hypothetical protein
MNVTVLYDDKLTTVDAHKTSGDDLWLAPDQFAKATGWKLEPQGLCKGDLCVQTNNDWLSDGNVNLTAFASHLGQPLVREESINAWAFGESVSARHDSMYSLQAPDFTLPDMHGKLHSLSDYRGKKVFIHSWGSY